MNPREGAKAIKEGKIDAMGVARQFLVDAEWVTKLIEGRENEIHPCICCHNGCFNMCHYKGLPNDQALGDAIHMARCALNPETMQSGKYHITPAKKVKNVAIIGGGIGGMETAIVLAKRGHKVTVFEKSKQLGGVFIAAAAPSFKESDRKLIEWYKHEIVKYPQIEIKYETEIKCPHCLEKQGHFDEVVVATGSLANRLRVPGGENAIDAVSFLNGNDKVGKNPIIIGGGLTGCEIAYELELQGKKPSIIEMKNDLIAVRGVCLANSSYLRDYFEYKKTPVYLETTVKEINDKGVIAVDKNGKEFVVEGSAVIASVGCKPTPAFEGRKIHLVGDCNSVGNLRTVIWRAWDVAMKI